MVDLSVKIGSLRLKNPVLTASGTFGYGRDYDEYLDIAQLGGIVTKTITLNPREGNPMPRIAETPAGMLNSIGLSNVGADRYLSDKLPALKNVDTVVIANVAGDTIEEYGEIVSRIQDQSRIDGIEINVSCPNVKQGGLAFGTNPDITAEVVRISRLETEKPLIVKLTPNVTDITEIALAAQESGADAVSCMNTLVGMGIDISTRKPLLHHILGGLSGPSIKPVALAKAYQIVQVLDIPVIGIGGIMTWEDAVEFLLAGVTAVQVGTLSFVDPYGSIAIIEGLRLYCQKNGISKVENLIGGMIQS
ncbi:dihydroorotate dehydrogenase [bacterium]|nr:dihydroorotate dehydrogenase [bacterium]